VCARPQDGITFLDVPTEIYDAAADRRYESVGHLLLRTIITTEGDHKRCILRLGRRTENWCGHECAVRDGGYERIEFA
jgi:hypothetical protein